MKGQTVTHSGGHRARRGDRRDSGRVPAAAEGGLRIGQRAPEITGGPWINSEPLSLEKLRGRVVFVEFWTYG